MKKIVFLLSALIFFSGLGLCLSCADAASSNEAPEKTFLSKSERDSLYAAFPELEKAEGETEFIYQRTRQLVGEEGGGGAWLGQDQRRWQDETDYQALRRHKPETAEFVQFLIDAAHERTEALGRVARLGRIVERQLYKANAPPERHMEIRHYQSGRTMVGIVSFPEEGRYDNCAFYSVKTSDDGNPQFVFPGAQTISAEIVKDGEFYVATYRKDGVFDCAFVSTTPPPADGEDSAFLDDLEVAVLTDADAYEATLVIVGSDADRPRGVAAFPGGYRRIDKAARSNDPTLEEVAACALGADGSQKIRVLRNDGIGDSFAYYVETSQGLIALASFADPKSRGSFDEVGKSRGISLSVSCDGDGVENVLVLSGEFWSAYHQTHVVRYDSGQGKWRVLSMAERYRPNLVYLGDDKMLAVVPTPISEPHEFIVYAMDGETIGVEREADERPSSKGYRVIEVAKNGPDAAGWETR